MGTDRSSLMRSQLAAGTCPRLVAISPSELQDTVFELVAERVVVGRGEQSDVRLDNQTLSRTHAAIERSTGQTTVSDLHSTNGTFVNGARVGEEPRVLNDGDRLRLGEIELRYKDAARNDATRALRAAPSASGPQRTEYHVDQQQAEQINNVGRDQHNEYYQYVQQQRESFARDIAATKTKARRLVVVGFALFVIGLAGYFTMFVGAFKTLSSANGPSSLQNFFGPKVGGVPVGLIGFAVAAIGSLLMLVGIVLHIVAASRRRQLLVSPPPPWAGVPPAPRGS